jgi:two-component system, NarL family, sensor histidine kinase DevS
MPGTALPYLSRRGINDGTRARIGKWPCGRGVLGDLILDPVPVCLAKVREHPDFYGFPGGHPRMRSFLGVPIVAGRGADGGLYLTEKAGGRSFTDEDQEWAPPTLGVAKAESSRGAKRRAWRSRV